jgi:tetratricopeptide (TPR) repeat protein
MGKSARAAASVLILLLWSCAAHALAQGPSYARLERAAELIRRGQLARAEAELAAVLRASPEEANALNLLGVVRAQQKRRGEAEQLFLRAVKSSPALLGAFVNLGQLYMSTGDDERALWAFDAAAALAPEHPEVNYHLAAIREGRREFARALEHLGKIPGELRGLEHLQLAVRCLLGLGRADEAAGLVAPLRSAQSTAAVPAEDAAGFAALFAAHARTDVALEILEAARGRAPGSFAVLYNLGATHLQRRELERAEEFYRRALAARPDDGPTLRALAGVERARGNLEKSLGYVERALRLDPDSRQLLYDYGWTALNLNRLPEALPALERLQRAHPQESAYIYALAVARFYNNEDAEALALLRRYIGLNPRDPRGHYVLGVMLQLMMRRADARAALAQSFELAPTADAAHYLGLVAYDEADLAQAEHWLRRAVELNPAHAPARAALGMTYVRRKDLAAARVELERAAALDPQDLTAAYQLGLLYTRLGERERAREMMALADRLRAEQRQAARAGLMLAEPPK